MHLILNRLWFVKFSLDLSATKKKKSNYLFSAVCITENTCWWTFSSSFVGVFRIVPAFELETGSPFSFNHLFCAKMQLCNPFFTWPSFWRRVSKWQVQLFEEWAFSVAWDFQCRALAFVDVFLIFFCASFLLWDLSTCFSQTVLLVARSFFFNVLLPRFGWCSHVAMYMATSAFS